MKTKNLSVAILAALLVTALWYTMLLKPIHAKASKARAATAAEQAKLTPLQAQLSAAQRDAAHAAQFKAELQSLEAAMPNSPALAAFVRDLNGVAQASGVSWQSVSHAPPTGGATGAVSITVGIQVKGSYAQVVDYVRRLASLQRLLVVDSVQLATSTTSAPTSGGASTSGGSTGPFSGGTQLAATISARMFMLSNVTAAGAGASTGAGTASATAPAPGAHA